MSAPATNQQKTSSGLRTRIPLLLNGDHLAAPEFERRYQAMPGAGRAELIEGIVVMAPPVSNDHSEGHGLLSHAFGCYARQTKGVAVGICGSLRLDGINEFQPDVFMRIKSGKSRVGADRLLEGAPELAAEIAISSAAYDLHEKKSVYERCGVQEYIVWQVMDAQFHWFSLEEGSYVELEPRADGVIRSRVFPGFWLNIRAVLAGDERRIIKTLEKGLDSVDHKAFVKSLKAQK